MLKTIPVYVISGLLESGKTTFIKDTIKSDDFYKKGKTLILSGEEGEVEYDNAFLIKYNSVVKYFDTQEDFSLENILKIVNDEKPNRVVIELNGMWDLSIIQFPTIFKVYQFIDFINFDTFEIYFANMRQKFLDTVKQSNVVCFINANSEDAQNRLENYSASFRLTNSNCQFMRMDEEGKLTDAFKIVYPFDKDADIIKIEDNDYGTWYLDTFDNRADYEGHVVEFNCMAVKSPRLPKGKFIAGRLAMTCCSNDIQLYGHLCVDNAKFKIKDRQPLHIIATVKYEWSEEYQEEECVLYPISIEENPAFTNDTLDLTK